MLEDLINAGVNAMKEVPKELYSDLVKPVAKGTGDVIGLVPQAVNAALLPLRKWILESEYNYLETKKLLDKKLANVEPDNIETPDAHIAVPALQYISYCMDNEELRNMYANLLANSMNKVVKNGVHPSFVEIIKQLSPDEARLLKFMAKNETAPVISVRYEDSTGSGFRIVKNFSNYGELAGCEMPYNITSYFDNLLRLGLIEQGPTMTSLTDKSRYEDLKKHDYILGYTDEGALKNIPYNKVKFVESYVTMTEYGKIFNRICVLENDVVVMRVGK